MQFFKYEGLGNDFVVVDLRGGAPAPSPIDPAIAVSLCDRHRGIGADGVLGVLPAASPGADARMVVINADGSEAEMCGNGIRCVAKALHDGALPGGAVRKPLLAIDTGAGRLECRVFEGADGRCESVAVAMGRPRTARAELPMEGAAGPVLGEALELAGARGPRRFAITGVSMGNPHAVTFVGDDEDPRALAEEFGPALERHRAFPRRTNAEFARVRGERIELVVWERGCGITLACGTGACATAVAATLTGRAPRGRELTVALPGGSLRITVAEDLSNVTMRGPARLVFAGELDLGPRD